MPQRRCADARSPLRGLTSRRLALRSDGAAGGCSLDAIFRASTPRDLRAGCGRIGSRRWISSVS
nr:MAG: hypothetical protein DIU78_24445 [Pseudomonadota bacterium]